MLPCENQRRLTNKVDKRQISVEGKLSKWKSTQQKTLRELPFYNHQTLKSPAFGKTKKPFGIMWLRILSPRFPEDFF